MPGYNKSNKGTKIRTTPIPRRNVSKGPPIMGNPIGATSRDITVLRKLVQKSKK